MFAIENGVTETTGVAAMIGRRVSVWESKERRPEERKDWLSRLKAGKQNWDAISALTDEASL
jgi:hypothetical protein